MSAMSDRSFQRVRRIFEDAPRSVVRRFTKALKVDGQEWEGKMAKRFRAPLPLGRNKNRTLHNRTGALRRSIGSRVSQPTSVHARVTMALRVFSAGVPYARIQEFGGVITPKRAKYLTIPLDANMTQAGVTKLSARQAINKGGFFATSKKGNLLIRDSEGVPLFVLKKKVKIPKGRLGFFKTWRDSQRSRLSRHRRALKFAIADARAGKG